MMNSSAAVAKRNDHAADARQEAGPEQGSSQRVEAAIAQAQRGLVRVAPGEAVDMAGRLYAAGNYAQAERVCRQLIAARPEHADAYNILGVTLSALGRPVDALANLRRAVELAPQAASFLSNLGEILRQQGALDEAEAALKAALARGPATAQLLNNLGIVQFERKEYDAAVALYRRALALQPGMAEASNNLGNALRRSGDSGGAAAAYQDALLARAGYAEAYNNLGTLLHEDGEDERAEHALRKAITLSPRYLEAHDNFATLLIARGREVEALRVLGDALAIASRHPATLLIVARLQCKRGSFEAAEQAARMVIADDPANVDALVALGQLLHETDRFDEAVTVLEAAVARDPDHSEARNFFGIALKSVGRLDEARVQILAAIDCNPALYGAYANLHDLVDFTDEPELAGRIERGLEEAEDLSAPALLPLHYAFARVLEDRGEHPRALDHYILGGRMKRAQLDYDEVGNSAFFEAIEEAFPRQLFEDRPTAGNPDPRPVFIVGMPRSGSTLVEQILASHPGVHGAGEVKALSRALSGLRDRFPALPRFPEVMAKAVPAQLDMIAATYLDDVSGAAGRAARITDKLLSNYFFVGLINLVLPNARIIHTRRDPLDTCLSAFTKLFKDDMPHSYDLGELGRYYARYRALMAHWEAVLPPGVMTTVDYEQVVADTETEARRLIDFIGLQWDPLCLAFHRSSRPVKTASVAQVRRPIYASSVKRAAKYGPGLQPLVDAIG